MADKTLDGLTVAILATDGFEQSELMEPRRALDAAGAQTRVVSPKDGEIKGWSGGDWGETVEVDVPLKEASAADYDALLLPGGVMNPDKLRMDKAAVAFVQAFVDAGKPVAAICHGPWTLIETGKMDGRRMTSWPSLQTDLVNAGVNWTDRPCVRDGNLVTSRNPGDVPVFNKEMIELFGDALGARSAA
ncbi:MAG: type 1 glutamine amidotransferase domain-containing protein [Hyphomicrobiales bacterium]